MTTLVTGGGGFLGGYLVDTLLARGEAVRVFGRGRYPRLEALDVETVRGDLRNADDVQRAVSGCHTVYHTAAVPGVWGPWEHYHSTNTAGTEHVLNACRTAGVCRLVYTSSPSVIYDGKDHDGADESLPYPSEDSFLCHYPHSKMLAERAVLAANGTDGLLTCALRPHLIWGPRDNHLIPRLIDRARTGRLRAVGDRTNRVSMTYVENAAEAHLRAAEALTEESPVAGQAYFINEPEPVRLWDWVDELLALVDLPPIRKSISLRSARRIGGVCEGIWKTLRLKGEPPMTRFVASQLGTTHTYSIQRAQQDFGYAPIVSVEEGMQRLGTWLRNDNTPAS